jgi:hypothetical protein
LPAAGAGDTSLSTATGRHTGPLPSSGSNISIFSCSFRSRVRSWITSLAAVSSADTKSRPCSTVTYPFRSASLLASAVLTRAFSTMSARSLVRDGAACARTREASARTREATWAELLSNWAYMVMTALAWDLKACWALLLPEAPGRWRERHRAQKR